MYRVAKALVFLGFGLGAIGAAVAIGAENFPLGRSIFAAGFLMAVVGIVAGILTGPVDDDVKISPWGMKLAVVGFGLAAIPTTLGVFFLGAEDKDVEVFFNIGLILVIAGLVIHGFFVFRGKTGA